MLASARSRLRPPTIYELVAMAMAFLALAGSSYAALTITGRNVKNSSLTGTDVKNNSLTGRDIRGLRSGDVADGTLLKGDFKAGQLPAGAQGPKGDKGDKGDRGLQGPPGPTLGGASATNTGANPTNTPEVNNGSHPVPLTTGGKLFVFARANLQTDCTAGTPKASLYVDGNPIPASGFDYPDNVLTTVNTMAVSDLVPAGFHEVAIQTDCVGGDMTGAPTTANGAIGAILLGG